MAIKTLLIKSGYSWKNGHNECFNGKLIEELFNCEIFITLTEAKELIEQWRREYNKVHLKSSLGYEPPAPDTRISVALAYWQAGKSCGANRTRYPGMKERQVPTL